MKKSQQRFYKSSADVPDDPDRYVITREDLEGEELEIYDRIAPKMDNPTPMQLQMLATYSFLASEFKKVVDNKKFASYLRRCMVYARNRLGIWKTEPIDHLELLLDCEQDWPMVFLYLDSAWEILAY